MPDLSLVSFQCEARSIGSAPQGRFLIDFAEPYPVVFMFLGAEYTFVAQRSGSGLPPLSPVLGKVLLKDVGNDLP